MRKFIWLCGSMCLVLLLLLSGCGASAGEPAAQNPEVTPSPAPVQTEIYITEVMGNNKASLRDADGDFSDWFEITNRSSEAVSTAGWTVTDGSKRSAWVFPDWQLEPGAQLTVFASGKDRCKYELHTDFSLADGEGLLLCDAYGRELCRFDGADYAADTSLVLTADGSYAESLYPTPGADNTGACYDALQAGFAATGPLVINEAVTENFTDFYDKAYGYPDWLEIKNISDAPVNLSDYYLSDREDEPQLFRLPELVLEPGYKMVFYCVGDAATDGDLRLIPFKLNGEREQVYLSDAAGLIDAISLKSIPYGCSYGRTDGENGWFYYSSPTPGADNQGGFRRISESPLCSEPGGAYEDVSTVTVSLQAAEGAVIYYTLDGSVPTEASPVYTEALTLSSTCTLRALAVEPGQLRSAVLTRDFYLNEGFTLPVISVWADNPKAFHDMYSAAVKNLELPGTVSFYEEGGSFSIGAGFSMHGETSLVLAKRNISMRFRAAYGSAVLDYDLFGGGVTEFTNLLLRSGQDYYYAVIRNELCQRLADEFSDTLVTQRGRYVILYLNGDYFGLYALKEKTNKQLYASLAEVSKDSVALNEATVRTTEPFYTEVIAYITGHDMTDPECYAHACELLDMDSLIDWIIMEGFSANNDLASGNVRYVRSSENGGQWHLVYYDLDATLLRTTRIFYNIFARERRSQQISALCNALIKSPDFRAAFLTRFSEAINGVLSNEHVLAVIDTLTAEIEPELPRDFARFGRDMSSYRYNINYVRSLFTAYNWQQQCIKAVTRIFKLTDAEKLQYFGS